MDTFLDILLYVGIGISIGTGFILTIAVVALIVFIKEKISPSKTKSQSEKESTELQYQASQNIIMINSITHYTIYENLKSELRKLRTELWKNDLVLPHFHILPNLEKMGNGLKILGKIEGKEFYKSSTQIKMDSEINNIMESLRTYYAEKSK